MGSISLKYRIAVVIFVLEAIMITVVLWTTSNESFNAAKQAQKEHEDVFFDVLNELSITALLTEEYDDIQYFLEQIVQKQDINKAFLINSENRVVSSSVFHHIGRHRPELMNTELVYSREQEIQSSAGALGILAVEFSNEVLIEERNKIRNRGITIAVIGMSIILVVGIAVGFALTRRLEILTIFARRFASGEEDVKVEVSGGDELADLGKTFNDMVSEVSQSKKLIYDEKEKIQLLMDSTAEAILGLDNDECCTFANKACVNVLTYENESMMLGIPLSDILNYKPGEYVASQSSVVKEFSAITTATKKTGEEFPIEYRQHPIISSEGVVGSVITFIDITQTKQKEYELAQYRNRLEELVEERTVELQKRTTQLEASNKELSAFSYSVSHDLRSPLRGINGYCHVLQDDYASQLDEDAIGYLNRIAENSKRMGSLIDDMLALSGISRQKMVLEELNLSRIVIEIINELRESAPDRKINFHITDDIKATGDQKFMKIALANLIGNASKYTKNIETAEIEFGCNEIDGRNVYYVKDNGAGFDMQYADKLFGAFQRLHRNDEFEGSGVGLATVARIIHRHNGEIWAESEVNKGATFYFTLNQK